MRWRARFATPRSASCAYPDAPAAVTAMARVADGYLVSGGIDGTCAVWTRHESREPLHPSHVVAEGDGGGDDGDDGGRSDDANETTSERGRPVSPDPATFVPEPVDDPEEDGIDAETRELRLAARLKWRNEEQFRDRNARVGGWFNAADPLGLRRAAFRSGFQSRKNDDERHVPSCTVRAIVPLYSRGDAPESPDVETTEPVDAADATKTPRLLAVAASAHGGGLVSGVFPGGRRGRVPARAAPTAPGGRDVLPRGPDVRGRTRRSSAGCLDGGDGRLARARAFSTSRPNPRRPETTRPTPNTTRRAVSAARHPRSSWRRPCAGTKAEP